MKDAQKTMKLLLNIVVVFFVTSCSHENKQMSSDKTGIFDDSLQYSETDPINKKDASGESVKSPFIFVGDSVVLPKFEIEVKLSEKAERKLKLDKESILVQASFSGVPKDTTVAEYTKWGKVEVGSSKIELFDKRVASFDNAKISKVAFDRLSDKNFEVLINVFTGRRISSANLLEIDFIEDKVYSLKGKRHVLKGKLIAGD